VTVLTGRAGVVAGATIRDLVARRSVRVALAALFFAVVLLAWFHRLVFNLNDAVLYGPNDESYGIRTYWSASYQHQNPFTQTRDTLNGAPEGLPLASAVQIANAVIPGVIWGLHYLVGFTAASNIFLLGGIMLTATSFYLLLDYLGFHPFAAVFGGYALAFNPWMLERAGAGHSGFMQAWIFPLMVVTMLHAHRRHNVTSAILVGLCLALSFYVSSYYGLLAGLVFVVFWALDFGMQQTWGDRLWSFTLFDISLVTAVIAFIPPLIAWHEQRRSVAAGVSNPVQDLQNLGATIQSYFVPSFRNPLLGRITEHLYPRAEFIWSENTLYLGWSLIILALVGAYWTYRRDPGFNWAPQTRYFVVAMMILAPAAFLCSLQRKTGIFGLEIPMPSYLMSQFTTFWRVFARFGLLVTMALAALAAVTLTIVARRYRRGWLIACAAILLLGFEYYDGVLPIYKLQETAYSKWIGRQPPGIVANYPMPTDNPAAIRLLARTFFQQVYNKHPEFMLFGSGYGDTREDAIRILTRYVTDPLTPGILKAEGVKYVLLHDDVFREAGETPPPVPPGFHLVARIPGNVRALRLNDNVKPADIATVLEQNAIPIAAVEGLPSPSVSFGKGFTTIGSASTFDGSGQIHLSWPVSDLRRTVLYVSAQSLGVKPETLTLADENGNQLGQWSIGSNPTDVSFGPLPLAGTSATYTLQSSGPLKIVHANTQPLADFSVSIRDY
jgi:hypothetical protein